MLLAAVAAARFLGVEGFGGFVLIQTTVLTGVVLASGGFSQASTRFTAILKTDDPDEAGAFLGFTLSATVLGSVLCAATLVIFPSWIAGDLLQSPELAGALRSASLWMLVAPLPGALGSSLAGLEAFRTSAFCSTIVGFSGASGVAVGAWLGGIEGAVLGAGIGTGLALIATGVLFAQEASRHGVQIRLGGALRHRKVLVPFVLPALLAGLMVTPVFWVANLMLAAHPNGVAEVGIFGAVRQYWSVIVFVPSIVSRPLLPVLSDCIGRGEWNAARFSVRISVFFILLVVGAAVASGFLLSRQLMGLFGAEFADHLMVLRLALLGALPFSVTIPLSQVLVSRERMWTVLALTGVWAATFLSLFALLRGQGALGCAAALAVSCGVQLACVALAAKLEFRGLSTPGRIP